MADEEDEHGLCCTDLANDLEKAKDESKEAEIVKTVGSASDLISLNLSQIKMTISQL